MYIKSFDIDSMQGETGANPVRARRREAYENRCCVCNVF